MKTVQLSDMPQKFNKNFMMYKIDVILKIIEDAGLLVQFESFIHSPEAFNIENLDDLCVEFAKKYLEKLDVIPENERYNHIILMNKVDNE